MQYADMTKREGAFDSWYWVERQCLQCYPRQLMHGFYDALKYESTTYTSKEQPVGAKT
jgi:hypothetical protein